MCEREVYRERVSVCMFRCVAHLYIYIYIYTYILLIYIYIYIYLDTNTRIEKACIHTHIQRLEDIMPDYGTLAPYWSEQLTRQLTALADSVRQEVLVCMYACMYAQLYICNFVCICVYKGK